MNITWMLCLHACDLDVCLFPVGHISMLKRDISNVFTFIKIAVVFANEIKWDKLVNDPRTILKRIERNLSPTNQNSFNRFQFSWIEN